MREILTGKRLERVEALMKWTARIIPKDGGYIYVFKKGTPKELLELKENCIIEE